MSLNLYPNIAKQQYNDQNNVGFKVFESGERLLPKSLNVDSTTDALWKEFKCPIYRIPSMVITDTGRIIVGADYRSKPIDQCAILPAIAFSDDNGKTWKKKVLDITPTHRNAFYRIMDQTMFYYKGVVHIICGKWNGTANNGNWTQTANDTTWSVNHYYSNDNGETWTKQENFQNVVTPSVGHSWLGGVGNAVVTKFGTCIVPIQISQAVGQVQMSFIWSNDGVTWNKASANSPGLSETSICQNVDTQGRVELIFFSRRDPNTGNNKSCKYIYQTAATTFGNAFNDYAIYNSKIPARGNSGCEGSAISMFDEKGVSLTDKLTILVSWANNYFNSFNTYIRDHISIGAFLYTKGDDNNSRLLRELDTINLKTAAWVNNTPYGGYSILNFNPKCNKLFIAYEDMGGIKVKCLNHLIPILKYESAN